MAIDLLQTPYEYSENWKKKHDIELNTQPTPEENFTRDSIYALHRFQIKEDHPDVREKQERLKNFDGDSSKMMKLLKMHQRLLAMRDELAKKLNTVVLK